MKKYTSKFAGFLFGVTLIILGGTQMAHADMTFANNGAIMTLDRAEFCFDEFLRGYMKNHVEFKKFYCTDPSNLTTCNDLIRKIFYDLFMGVDGGAPGAFAQARENECSEQAEAFKTLTEFILETFSPLGSVTAQDRRVAGLNLAVSFNQCIVNNGCPDPRPPVATPVPGMGAFAPAGSATSGGSIVSGIPAPGSQANGPSNPATTGAPTGGEPQANGGCSMIEGQSGGSFNYALFLAFAGLARGIVLVRNFLKK